MVIVISLSVLFLPSIDVDGNGASLLTVEANSKFLTNSTIKIV